MSKKGKQVKRFLKVWNSDKQVAGLLSHLKTFQFIHLNNLTSLGLSKSPLLIYYQYLKPVIGESGVEINNSRQLSIGKMYPLNCLIGEFGYLFEFPDLELFHGPGYFAVGSKIGPKAQGAQVVIKSQYLSVFSAENSILCIGKIPTTWVERYGFYQNR